MKRELSKIFVLAAMAFAFGATAAVTDYGWVFDESAQRNRVNVRTSADIGNNGSSPVFSDDSSGAAKTLSHGFRLWLPCHAAK